MVIFLLKITPSAQQQREVLEILHHVEGPTSVYLDCLGCSIYERAGDSQEVLYLEQWNTLDAMYRHIQSAMFAKILAAMEMSTARPEVQFYEVSQSWGLDLVKALRTQEESADRAAE
jgi:quinol monooxygenase YgiN